MKITEVLFEFSREQDALLRISQVVPHMAAANISIDPANVAKFTAMDQAAVSTALQKFMRKGAPATQGNMHPSLHAAFATALYLKHNRLNPRQISKQMLEQVSGLQYDQLVAVAEQHLEEIRSAVMSFRPSWLVPVEKKSWTDMSPQDRKVLIVSHADKLLKAGAPTITAKDIARSLQMGGNIDVKELDSLRKSIDNFLSSNDPEALRLNLKRPVGKTHRPGDDTGPGIRVW